MPYEVRWMENRDIPRLVEIEENTFKFGPKWTKDDFLITRRDRSVIGQVCELDDVIVGYAIHEIDTHAIYLLHTNVDKQAEFEPVMNQMLGRLSRKMTADRQIIYYRVHERNLLLQLTLRELGYKAVKVLKRYCGEDDTYLFVYRDRKAS